MPDLKTVVPGRLAVMAQPQPQEIEALARAGYRTLINNRPDGESQDQPSAAAIEAEAIRHGLRYVHLPVNAADLGRQEVEAFHRVLAEGPQPAAAHCGSGRRSFLLWAVGEVLADREDAPTLVLQATGLGLDVKDLPEVVARVRAG